jgi:6-phosphogluconolactonase
MHPTLAPFALLFLGLAATASAGDSSCWVYFGTQTADSTSGIYRSRLDQETGELSAPQRVTDKPKSVFMAFSPDRTKLYSLAEIPTANGHSEAIETYSVDAATGNLVQIGERVAPGSEGCHINVDPTGRYVLTANYGDHYVEVFPIAADGTVAERRSIIHFTGSGPNASRQESAHPHSVNFDPTGSFAFVADLGADRIYIYRLDGPGGSLSPADPAYTQMAPGSGPRHFAFHPDGKHAFVINELEGSITAMTWDRENGTLTPYQTVTILRKEYVGVNTSSEVVVSRSGRFVYGANRGDDSIVVHAFDPSTGKLTFVQRITDGIKVPRNYAIDPSGKWLVCANLTGGTATVYRIDAQSGKLSLTGSVNVPEALCVRFLQI